MKLLKSFFFKFCSCFQYLLCFLKISKRRKQSGDLLLPLYAHSNRENENNNDEFETWQEWNMNYNNEPVENRNSSNQQNNSYNTNKSSRKNSKSNGDDDFFKELEPTIKKTKKYFVGENVNLSKLIPKPKSFNYSTDMVGQLGPLEDGDGWDDGDLKIGEDKNLSWTH